VLEAALATARLARIVELIAFRVASRTPLPTLLRPEVADEAMYLVRANRRGPVCGAILEVVEPTDPVRGARLAVDGDIGKIDEATREVGAGYVVVDTGPWIFGRKVMLPAGTVERVDWDDKSVFVDRTKEEIKDSPELGDNGLTDRSYRDRVGTYYGDTYKERSSL